MAVEERSGWVEDLLAPGRVLTVSADGLRCGLDGEGGEGGRSYDRWAAVYDRIVGNALYNRLVWAACPRSYAAFAAQAVTAERGPLLDVGCGSAVFTGGVYRAAGRPLVLVNRSRAMLTQGGRAGRRRPPGPRGPGAGRSV